MFLHENQGLDIKYNWTCQKYGKSHPTEKVGWLFLCQKIISKKFLLSGTFCVSDLGVSMEEHYNMLVPPQLR